MIIILGIACILSIIALIIGSVAISKENFTQNLDGEKFPPLVDSPSNGKLGVFTPGGICPVTMAGGGGTGGIGQVVGGAFPEQKGMQPIPAIHPFLNKLPAPTFPGNEYPQNVLNPRCLSNCPGSMSVLL